MGVIDQLFSLDLLFENHPKLINIFSHGIVV
ncbi:hypothetical protein Halhy_3083 [Haliscomenobacter hydrossis DSM 1100]|uniref:Uncharacterized protein n=1 Tax=Haliscomenobacter hydrossis (strain ATCC 27775 / DSM 1100 / LMG 10767 / O) TaxID=760192 RepID=F4KPK8_HALH1|nr:hypothetical protein Halhy_3083 [Haliscomenobacter hydrossis DSM 1100]